MKTISILAAVTLAALASGCSTTNISELVKAASADPAKVDFTVTTLYGKVEYHREMPVQAVPAVVANPAK